MRHSKVEPPSLEEKSKSASAPAVGFEGDESIVVCGAVVSYVKVRSAAPRRSRRRRPRARAPCSCRRPGSWKPGKAYDQLPAAMLAVFQTSEPEANAVPFQ